MILLDTNIIVDLPGDDEHDEASWSRSIHAHHYGREPFVCNLVVVAELAAPVPSRDWLMTELKAFRIDIRDIPIDGAFAAGRAHAAYRQRGGARNTILADFLIAGHAEASGATLITRDRRLSGYFPDLTLITPETHP